MKNRMVCCQFYHFFIWKQFFDFFANILIHAIIVIDMKKTTTDEVVAQIFDFLSIEINISVPCHVDKRMVENLDTFGGNSYSSRIDRGSDVFIAKLNEIGQ